MIGRSLLAAWLMVAIAASGCAARDVTVDHSAGVPVPSGLVPAAMPEFKLTLDLDKSSDIKTAIAEAGPQVLVGDARMWNVHRGQKLVGALQLSTLRMRVDPRRADDRNAIVDQALGSRSRQIIVGGLPVWTVPDDGSKRGVYIWFGAHSFAVLQLKSDGLDADAGAVADQLIGDIAKQPAWQALPPQAYETSLAR